MTGETKVIPHECFPVVDVREVAMAHFKAITVKKAKNRRFCLVNESAWSIDLFKPVADKFGPEGWPVSTTVAPIPENFNRSEMIQIDNTASKKVLGI